MPRIALYSHDTFGLGHLRRSLKLAEHIQRHFGAVEGLLLSGSVWHTLFPIPAGFRVEALPPVTKTEDGLYSSRDKRAELATVLRHRQQLISASLADFRPDLFVVDNVPCGLHGEVLPGLRQLRRQGTRTVLALRDVLDDLDAIRCEWERAGAYQAVAELFDEIWVFGDTSDAETLIDGGPLADVASKVHSCGRIGHLEAAPNSRPPSSSGSQKPVVLVTGGGGRDASPLVRTYMDVVSAFRPAVTSHVVLGPDFPSHDRARLAITPRAGLTVADFVPDLPAWLARSSVIVSMAGYNTVCEILASGRPAVLVPRITPRQEQLLRARRWQRSGRIRMIDPRQLCPETLWTAVEQLLDAPPVASGEFRGGQIAAHRAAALLGGTI